MHKALLLFIFVCSICTAQAQQFSDTLDVNGVDRNFITYLPVNFDPQTESLPLVIVYHGLTMNNETLTFAGFNAIADTARLILMYPQGLTNSFGQTSWNNETGLSPMAEDIYFSNLLIDTAMLMYNIDLSRVYAAGVSMGSIMSYRLACDLNDRFAAIGCIFGPMATSVMADCDPSYSTPIIHFHGTDDATVPYDSNPLPTLSLATETIAWWENEKTCDGSMDSTRIADIANDGLTTDRFVYNGCTADGSLEHWRTNGGDHDFYIQPVNDFNHFIETWKFLRKWQHPNPRNTLSTASFNTIEASIFPNPSSTSISLLFDQEKFKVEIYDLLGQLVLEVEDKKNIDINHLKEGVYQLVISTKEAITSQRFVVQ
ncbi:polyhydroxybutyrate depolymerase [Lishizhenia tianjinensis]|uniref:Polyhydroxybutyrate depolymerase n=1 Tax=Lishizhenia tianjinensis TaxID=477690 RepID=A0A1I6XJ94_9FLAO|nr:T9SS type A sorting domain-containing protein [Lishizhenia tianjinensis]SFT38147.1 polyhydroxybutyrate depolymerase [Lishizhenia tianjinensis]